MKNRVPPLSRTRARLARMAVLFAVLGLAAGSARAIPAAPASPTFNPDATVTYGPDSNNLFTPGDGDISGAALTPGANGVTGATFSGGIAFIQNSPAEAIGTVTFFTISGSGNNAPLDALSDTFSGNYDFTLAGSGEPPDGFAVGEPPAGFAVIGSWSLDYSVTTGGGLTSSGSATGTGGGGFSGTVSFTIAGADAHDTLASYTVSLSAEYLVFSEAQPQFLSVTVPSGSSVDFNATPAPEPGTWAILALGGVGASGVRWMRVRRRRHGNADAPAR